MYELAVIIPTLNESANIAPLIARIEAALAGVDWELIFIDDDSSDHTWRTVWQAAGSRRNIRCERRVGRRGLSSACIEGMLSSNARFLTVMDADLQHDETLLPRMLEELKSNQLDIVIASRFVGDADASLGLSEARRFMSRTGNWISRRICRAQLTDPLSGYFMLRRDLVEEVVYDLSSVGFKILIDIFASSSRPLRFRELPFVFRKRQHGTSKLNASVLMDFLKLLSDKTLGRLLPVEFIEFVMVGGIGVVAHLNILAAARAADLSFRSAQITATVLVILLNFNLNNLFTYRYSRLTGSAYWAGLLKFVLVCSMGAYVNVISSTSLTAGVEWWLAGGIGAFIGGLWNYSVSAFFVWRKQSPARVAVLAKSAGVQ